ncbi:ParB/RepB/Spo0J family partition protein [Burkholderia gladioli]|uniref:ParB/RepB/Spo0J family partition protein n=1 Tax=Burkholderia gladioli TaxID=28095 RepID=UPI001640E35A|nr:ParB/RepB/Spo0J family partition protein [Burkholderia gladioli]
MKTRDIEIGSLKKIAETKGQNAVTIKKRTDYDLDPRDIEIVPGWNARDDTPELREHIDSIKQSIKDGGVIPQLIVRCDGPHIYVIDGHCRLTAVMELIREGFDIKFVSVREVKWSDADRESYRLTSAQGLALTRLEQGRGAVRLERMGWSISQIARRAGKSEKYVSQNMALANANSDVHVLLISKMVAAKVALAAIAKHGEKAGAVLASRLKVAQSDGAARLTEKAFRAPTLKPATATRVRASLDGMFGAMPAIERERIERAGDADEIPVRASFLKELLAAHAAAATPPAERKPKPKKAEHAPD